MKTKMGRPVLPKGEAKGVVMCARFTEPEGKEISQAIKRDKTPKAEWVRNALLKSARTGNL